MANKLERNPIYQQLHALLKQSMTQDYKPGDRFLTERQISEKFEVSRATANKALASLVSEGLLEFKRGVGTFVRGDVINYDVRSLVSFTDKAILAGLTPGTKVLAFAKVLASDVDAGIGDVLQIKPNDRLWEIKRLRLADEQPVILEHRYVVCALCPRLTQTQAKGSLYAAWTTKHALEISGAENVISAVALSPADAKLLKAPANLPALQVQSVGYLADGKPLWWEKTLYRSDRYVFESRLGPIQFATPARGVLNR